MNNPGGVPDNFGASIREEVMALPDIKDRAYKLSNELLGAYDEVSVVGQQVRKYLIPFWSWQEVNFRRTKQLIFNSFRDAGLCRTVARKIIPMVAIRSPFIASNIGKFALKAGLLWGILQAWNNLRFPDEEKELSDKVKAGPHIIYGRDKDGKILYLDRLGFVQDFLNWFGVESFPYNIQQWLNGKMSAKEVATEMAKGPLNKIVQGVGPIVKTPVELLMGRSTYPNIYKPKGIRDPWEYLFRGFALENEYKYLAGKPMPTHGGSREEALWNSMRKSLALESDPMESAYYDVQDDKRRFMKEIGKVGAEGFYYTPKSNALYYFKQSIRYGDKQAAVKYLTEYALRGGTEKGLKQSLKTLHPLYGLNKEEQVLYVRTLNQKDAEKLFSALVYYETVLNPQ
ncbi:MAG TPA: hypothetical protein DCR71_00035 [Dehalococcoidia bacterium]|nr:hypothetical protein [Dehalococcoidia bacterium]